MEKSLDTSILETIKALPGAIEVWVNKYSIDVKTEPELQDALIRGVESLGFRHISERTK